VERSTLLNETEINTPGNMQVRHDDPASDHEGIARKGIPSFLEIVDGDAAELVDVVLGALHSNLAAKAGRRRELHATSARWIEDMA
jgi:hypothetical protein